MFNHYLFSALIFFLLVYVSGSIYSLFTHRSDRISIEQIIQNSAYFFAVSICLLFIFNQFFPLDSLLSHKVIWLFLGVASVYSTYKLRPTISVFSVILFLAYFLFSVFIFQFDIAKNTKFSIGWNEDYFYHERITRVISQYGRMFHQSYQPGYIETIGQSIDRIRYPLGSHILIRLMASFEELFQPVEIYVSKAKLLFVYGFLVSVVMLRRKTNKWLSLLLSIGIFSSPLMISNASNDFVGQFPTFFLIFLMVWHLLYDKLLSFRSIIIISALLISYYFMLIPFGLLILISVIVSTLYKSRRLYSIILVGIIVGFFVYYLPMAAHIKSDVVPGGLTKKFTFSEVLGSRLIYSGVEHESRSRRLTLMVVSAMTLVFLMISIKKSVSAINKSPESYLFALKVIVMGLAILLVYVSYFFVKPYLFYKLLIPIYLAILILLSFGAEKWGRKSKVIFVIAWIFMISLNLYYSRLYWYNPTRMVNSQLADSPVFRQAQAEAKSGAIVIFDNIFFNNLVSLLNNDANIQTFTAYSDKLSTLIKNNQFQDSKFNLLNYPIDSFQKIIISADLHTSTPPLPRSLYSVSTESGLAVYESKRLQASQLYYGSYPLIVKNLDQMRAIFSDSQQSGKAVLIAQNIQGIQEIVTSEFDSNLNGREHFLNKYPYLVFAIYQTSENLPLGSTKINSNFYFNQFASVLSGDFSKSVYKVDVGLYADYLYLDKLEKYRYWDVARGWSRVLDNDSVVKIPVITHFPKTISFDIEPLSDNAITIRNPECELNESYQLHSGTYSILTLEIPTDCKADQYQFTFSEANNDEPRYVLDSLSVSY